MAVLRYFHQDPKQTSVQESSIVDRLGTALTLKLTNINQSINNNTLAIDDKLNSIPGKSLSTNDFTDEYKDKLRGIEEGAEVNVQSDWGEDDDTADSYIKNKPESLPASDVYEWAKQPTKPVYTDDEIIGLSTNYIPVSQKGVYGGVATLGANDGKVPESQLPSYVDDVLEYTNKSKFPSVGESGKIYVDITTNLTYRWTGTQYTEISPSIALGETSSTAYAGDKGKRLADAINDTLNYDDTLDWNMAVAIARVNGIEITAKLPSNPNVWNANSKNVAGYVSAPGAVANKVWKTDDNGNPAWRDDANTTYTFTDANPTLSWNTKSKIATVGGTDIHVTMPSNPNTWRPISDSTNETSSTTSASLTAVKAAYDLAASKTSNTGTVTSVGLTVPTGLSVNGSPVTTKGTLAITLAKGYSIPTTAKQDAWDAKQDAISDLSTIRSNASHGQTAYGWGNHALAGYQPAISDLATIRSNASEGHTAYGWGDHSKAGYVKSSGVTSVAMTVPTGLAISGSPITSTGTLALSFANGYSIPTTAKLGNWDTAYGWGNHANAGYLKQHLSLAGYLPLSGGTLSGSLGFGNDNTKFLITTGTNGSASPLRGTTLPATSSNFIGIFARPSKATDEGGILLSEDTCVVYNSHDTGWGFLVVDTDLSQSDWSAASAQAFGINSSHLAWSLGGFVKSGSDSSHVLLGDGGHKAVSDFATSGHNHNSSYVASVSISGNSLRINKNGANTDLTIPYATSAGSATNASNLVSNTRMDYGWNGINYFNLDAANQSKAKVNDTPYSSATWTHILRFNHADNSGYYTDLAIPFNANGIYYKRIANGSLQNSTTNGGWISVLDNLNSSVSKSGETLTVKINGTSQSLTNTNTWRGILNNLTSDSTTDSLSAAQGKALANGSARDSTKLPLAGGTMTGSLTVKQYIFGYNYNHAGGNAPAFVFDKPGSNYTGIGCHSTSDTIWFGAATISSGEAAWVDSYKQKWVFNGTVTADRFYGPLTGNVTGNADTATDATNATNLTGNPSLQAGTSNTDAITVTAGNKTSAEFVVPHSTKTLKLISSGSIDTTTVNSFCEASVFKMAYLDNTAANTLFSGSDGFLFSVGVGGGYGHQIHIDDTRYNIWHRKTKGPNLDWDSWVKILDTSNVSPSLDISGNTIAITIGGITSSYITVPYATNAGNADTVDSLHASNFTRFFLSPMTAGAPADSAKSWFTDTMPSASGAIVYNVPGSEKTIIAGKSSGAYGHMLQLNYDDTYLRILRYAGGNWKSTDWEKISAGYADSAGSVAWTNVSDRPTNLNLFTNGPGYITSITKTMVTNALGYTPPKQDTNNAVVLNHTTTNAFYRLLFSGTNDDTNRTEGARKNTNLLVNPNFGGIHAKGFFPTTVGSYDDAWTDSYNKKHPWYGIDFRQESGTNYFHSVYSDYFGMCFRTYFIKIAVGDFSAGAAELARTIYINNAIDTNPIIFSVAGTISAENRLLAPNTYTTHIDGRGSDEGGEGPLYILCNQDEPVVIASGAQLVGIGKKPTLGKVDINGVCHASLFMPNSDLRLKDILSNMSINLKDISEAPVFLFKWKDKNIDNLVHVGTSAQYWKEKVPELVSEANDDIKTLSLDYSALSVASNVTLAKEVVSLKEEIKLLQALIAELKLLLNN